MEEALLQIGDREFGQVAGITPGERPAGRLQKFFAQASSLSDLEQRQIHPALPCSAHGRPVRQY
jgi:hypothetical protein